MINTMVNVLKMLGNLDYMDVKKAIKLPNSIISIGKYAFYGCNPNLKIIRK